MERDNNAVSIFLQDKDPLLENFIYLWGMYTVEELATLGLETLKRTKYQLTQAYNKRGKKSCKIPTDQETPELHRIYPQCYNDTKTIKR